MRIAKNHSNVQAVMTSKDNRAGPGATSISWPLHMGKKITPMRLSICCFDKAIQEYAGDFVDHRYYT